MKAAGSKRSEDPPEASLRAEFRAILAVLIFSSLLPLFAGVACSEERSRTMAKLRRERDRSTLQAEDPDVSGRKQPPAAQKRGG